MDNSELIAQYDLTTGKAVYWRMVRRDFITGQDHILMGWLKEPTESAMRKRAKREGCTTFERAAA